MKHPKLTARKIRDFMASVPFAVLLGIKLTRVHRDGVTIECALRPELTNSFAVAHGGVAATLADAAVGVALNRHFGGKRPITTVEMKINYFLAGTEAGCLPAPAFFVLDRLSALAALTSLIREAAIWVRPS